MASLVENTEYVKVPPKNTSGACKELDSRRSVTTSVFRETQVAAKDRVVTSKDRVETMLKHFKRVVTVSVLLLFLRSLFLPHLMPQHGGKPAKLMTAEQLSQVFKMLDGVGGAIIGALTYDNTFLHQLLTTTSPKQNGSGTTEHLF